eukprot:TRINITY_DN2188_c0_g1_i1.p1 TRINITY_DN2188_c0_g1~~TRINITY_DN2188_c0_g1_i1.p1  ORF type:complete len:112 (-),score=26.44 TRINITY_DN2188_c0_g1_i1:42-377(-)
MSESIGGISVLLADKYGEKTSKKVQLLDAYLLYVFITGVMQFIYMGLVGTFPFNSFLAGFLGCVACFAVGVSLRLQLVSPKEFDGISPEHAFLHFMICQVLIHFVVLTYIG